MKLTSAALFVCLTLSIIGAQSLKPRSGFAQLSSQDNKFLLNPYIHEETYANYPKTVNAILEALAGTTTRYKYNEETKVFEEDYILKPGHTLPANYGSVPQTLAGDGDPLDIFVYCSKTFEIGDIVESMPIGVMYYEDKDGKDNKLVAICMEDNPS